MLQVDTQRHIITDDTVQFGTDIKTSGSLVLDGLAAAPAATPYFGTFYCLNADGKPYFKSSAGIVYDIGMIGSNPMVFKGSIGVATNFPLVAAVQTGWVYRITADVTDNGGATYTNTGQNFSAGDEVAWNGTNWSDLGTNTALVVASATPYAVIDTARNIAVDTVTIAAPSAVNLPTAVGRTGKQIVVVDGTGSAATYPISVTPSGAEVINGVNAALVINRAYGSVVIVSNGAGWVSLGNEQIIADANISATIPGIAFQTLGSKANAALNGDSTRYFIPEKIECIATAIGGGATNNGNAQIIVGTTDGGTQICPAHPVSITVNHGVATITLEGGFAPIAGNATIYAQVSTADTNMAANLTVTVRVIGRQV